MHLDEYVHPLSRRKLKVTSAVKIKQNTSKEKPNAVLVTMNMYHDEV